MQILLVQSYCRFHAHWYPCNEGLINEWEGSFEAKIFMSDSGLQALILPNKGIGSTFNFKPRQAHTKLSLALHAILKLYQLILFHCNKRNVFSTFIFTENP